MNSFVENCGDPIRCIGKKFRQARITRGYTQEELADKAGFHRTYVGVVERGEKNISIVNCYRLARALEISMSELFTGIEYLVEQE